MAKQKFFLREWRKHRGYTQERLAEMLGTSKGVVSDLEKGNRRYNQDHLEAFAAALRCTPGDLVTRDPTAPDPLWSIIERIPEVNRPQAIAMLEALAKKTGTDG